MSRSGRILGIDPGYKRIGVAISDPEGKMALPLTVIEVTGTVQVESLLDLVRDREVSEIVVGLPLRLDGSEGSAAGKARQLAGDLQSKVDLPVHLVDERLTTVQANRDLASAGMSTRRARRVVDSLAAAVVLQSFLDSRKKQ